MQVILDTLLVRHFERTQAALVRLKAAADGSVAVKAAVGDLEVEVARLGGVIIEHESHLHHQRELNPQIEWIADAEGSVIAMGPRWERLTGLTQAQSMGLGWRTIIHPDDLQEYEKAACDDLRRKAGYDISFRGLTAGGEYRWLRARAAARIGPDGGLLFPPGLHS